MSAPDDRTMAWMAGWWDDDASLVTYPSSEGSPHNPYQRPGVHLVRESAFYAVGLLERDRSGDRERAARAIGAVLAQQIDRPGSVVHGTWRRAPVEPLPGQKPREWIDYDPNWREFVGTALALALFHEEKLPGELVSDVDAALRKAVEGALARDVAPDYTNIALLCAFLLDWTGERFAEDAWRERGRRLGDAVADAYDAVGAFPEHNSPTYYGVDLYGAALWRERAPSARLRARGAALEEALWRDLARFYHAGLRNLCGPYTRAYGMDMTRYVAGLGTWIAAAVAPENAPTPEPGDAVEHAHDFFAAPLVAALGSRPPDDVRADLTRFGGPHSVEQIIRARPRRVATARLRESAMWGGEDSGGRPIHWQHHPATLHWRSAPLQVGWLRLVCNAPADARADDEGLAITVHTGLDWLRDAEISLWLEIEPLPAGTEPAAPVWNLPGLRLGVSSDPNLAWRMRAEPGAPTRVGTVFAAGAAPERVVLRLRVDPPAA